MSGAGGDDLPVVVATEWFKGRSDVDGSKAINLSDYVNSQFDPTLSWKDLEWIREESGLPIMLKGIQCVEDAKTAASLGVDAIAL